MIRANHHVDIVKSLGAIGIGEVHMANLKLALYLFRTVAAFWLHVRLGLHHGEIALSIDESIVESIEDSLQLSDGCRYVGKEHDMVHNLTNCHAWIVDQHQVGGKNDNKHGAYLLHEALPTVVVKHHLAGAQLIVGEVGLDSQLFVALNLFTVERLDNIDTLNDIDNTIALQLAGMAHLLPPSA